MEMLGDVHVSNRFNAGRFLAAETPRMKMEMELSNLRFNSNALTGLEEGLAGMARGVVDIEADIVTQVVG
jgi:hypothetical protein